MIVLKITNSSELVASKIGKFLVGLTPEGFDANTVEDIVLRKLVENLAAEGLAGEVATVQGLDLDTRTGSAELVLQERMRVRHHQSF
ncbi:MAG: hypothetical protein ACKO6F_07185 [Cyanobium sp.]